MRSKLEGIDAYPLCWPEGWPRSRTRERSRFECTLGQTRDRIIHNLELMGVGDWNVILSTNVPLRRDGLPYANTREPDDPGVAAYWTQNGQRQCIACDRWDRVRDNLRAVEKTLDALRGIERWGSSDIVSKAFTGFAALPPALEGWRAILGDCSSLAEVEAAWKRYAFERHPDRGGSDAAMYELNAAYAAARRELS